MCAQMGGRRDKPINHAATLWMDFRTSNYPYMVVYAPETKSLTEVAGLSGCAGVKFRRQEALCVERRGLGDEGRGAVCKGALRGADRGDQQARGGASFWHRPSDGGEDAVILGAAGIPAQPAAGASEAGSIRGDHRPDPGRG